MIDDTDKLKSAELQLRLVEENSTSDTIQGIKQKYYNLVNFLPIIIFECTPEGILTFINSYGIKKLNIKLNELKNNFNIFEHLSLITNIEFRKYYDTELKIENEFNEFETEILINQIQLIMTIRLSKVNENNNIGIRGICFDITITRKTENRLSELSKCFLNFTTDPETNIRKLVDYIGELSNADCALYNKLDNGYICCLAGWNLPLDYYPIDLPEGHICTDVINENKNLVYIDDLQNSKYKNTDKSVKDHDVQTYIAHSVKFEGQNIGCISLIYKNYYKLSEELKWLLQMVSSAIAIEESRRYDYTSITRANVILELTLEITNKIMSSIEDVNIDEVLEMIGFKLQAKKVFLLRFPVIHSSYKEWIQPGFECEKNEKQENEDDINIVQLIEWVYKGEAFCANLENYPSIFKPIIKTKNVLNYYKLFVPILINNKPWGIMGLGEISTSPTSNIVRTAFTNLCKIISILIKDKETREKLNIIIDQKMEEFKENIKQRTI